MTDTANTVIDTSTMTVDQANALKLTQFQEIANSVAQMVAVISATQALYFPSLPAEYSSMTNVCIQCCDSLAQQLGLGSYLQVTGQLPAQVFMPIPNLDANGVIIPS